MKGIISICLALSAHALVYVGLGPVSSEPKELETVEITPPPAVTTVAVIQFASSVDTQAETDPVPPPTPEPRPEPPREPDPIPEPEPVKTPEPIVTLNPALVDPIEPEPIYTVIEDKPITRPIIESQSRPYVKRTRTLVTATPHSMQLPSSNAKNTGAAQQTKPLSSSGKRAQRKYLGDLMAWLAEHQEYPPALKKKRIEGVVHVRFTVAKDGRVTNMSIVESSGYPELDDAALAVLRRANPVPKFPRKLKREQMSLTLPIEFSLITE